MQVTFPPNIQAIIERRVASGEFDNPEEVLIEAVSRLDNDSPRVDDSLLVEARRQADAGEVVPWTDDFMDRASARSRDNSRNGITVRDEIKY